MATLEHWHLAVDPEPSGRLEALDAEGNRVPCLWFEEPTEMLRLRSRFSLHTESAAAGARCPQPPGWVAATALELRSHFLSCLALREGYGDPVVAAFMEVLRRRAADPLAFLAALNAHLQETSSGKPARRVGHCCRRRLSDVNQVDRRRQSG